MSKKLKKSITILTIIILVVYVFYRTLDTAYCTGFDRVLCCKFEPVLSRTAGLGIAFHAKPKVAANASQSINTIGLDGILYFLGFKDSYLGEQGKL